MVAALRDSVKFYVQGWGMEEAPLLNLLDGESRRWVIAGRKSVRTSAPVKSRGLEDAMVR